jgi:oxaloacetate decarboxylase gamma subunit
MLLTQGLELMVYGMGTVVLFLSLLVFATRGMSTLTLRYFPEPPEPPAPPRREAPAPESDAGEPTAETIAAITIAIHRHRH